MTPPKSTKTIAICFFILLSSSDHTTTHGAPLVEWTTPTAPTAPYTSHSDNQASVGQANITVPYVFLGVRPVFALGSANGTYADEVFYTEENEQPKWQMEPAQSGFYGLKFHRNDSAAGSPAYRFEGIASTQADLGSLSDKSPRTVSFSLKATDSSKGFVYAILHNWRNETAAGAVELPLLDALEASIDESTTLSSDFFSLGYTIFSAVHLDGSKQTLTVVSVLPPSDSSSAPTVRSETFSNPELFDGSWHLVAVVLEPSGGDFIAQLFVDGATSYNDRSFRKCRADSLYETYSEPTTGSYALSSLETTTEKVTTGGVLVTGYLDDASLFNLQLHGAALDQTKIITTLGTEAMKKEVSIGQIPGIVLAVILLLIGLWVAGDVVLQIREEINVSSSLPSSSASSTKQDPKTNTEEEDDDDDDSNGGVEVEQNSRPTTARSAWEVSDDKKEEGGTLNPMEEDPLGPSADKEEGTESSSGDEEDEQAKDEKQKTTGKGEGKKKIGNAEAGKQAKGRIGQAKTGATQGTKVVKSVSAGGDAGSVAATGGVQVVEKLLVTVPAFFDVFQGLSLYLRGWEWPYTFTFTVSIISLPFSFDFTFAGFSIPPWVTIVLLFLLGTAGVVAIVYFARKDQTVFQDTMTQYNSEQVHFERLVESTLVNHWKKAKLPKQSSINFFEVAQLITRTRRARGWTNSDLYDLFPELLSEDGKESLLTGDQETALVNIIPHPPSNALEAALREYFNLEGLVAYRTYELSQALAHAKPGDSFVDIARVHGSMSLSFEAAEKVLKFLKKTFVVMMEEVDSTKKNDSETDRPKLSGHRISPELIESFKHVVGRSTLPEPDALNPPEIQLELYLHPIELQIASKNKPGAEGSENDFGHLKADMSSEITKELFSKAQSWSAQSDREKFIKKKSPAEATGFMTARWRTVAMKKQRKELRSALNNLSQHGSAWNVPDLTLCPTELLQEEIKKERKRREEEAKKKEKNKDTSDANATTADPSTAEAEEEGQEQLVDVAHIQIPDQDQWVLLEAQVLPCWMTPDGRIIHEPAVVATSSTESKKPEQQDDTHQRDLTTDSLVEAVGPNAEQVPKESAVDDDDEDDGSDDQEEEEMATLKKKSSNLNEAEAEKKKEEQEAEDKEKESAGLIKVNVLSGYFAPYTKFKDYVAKESLALKAKNKKLDQAAAGMNRWFNEQMEGDAESLSSSSNSSSSEVPAEWAKHDDDYDNSDFEGSDEEEDSELQMQQSLANLHTRGEEENDLDPNARRTLGTRVNFHISMQAPRPMHCPRHHCHVIEAQPRHFQVRNPDGTLPYLCALTLSYFYKKEHKLNSCTAAELYVCPRDDCAYSVCKSCAAKFGAKAKGTAIVATKIDAAKREPAAAAALITFLALQFIYLPAVQNALMVVACHPVFHCTFPVCYQEPSVNFIVAATFSALLAVLLGLGLPLFWANALVQRRRSISQNVNSKQQWTRFLELDHSVLSNLYRKYEQTFILFEPLLLITGKASIVLVVAFTEANSLFQYVSICFFQVMNALIIIITDPLIDPWADVAIKVGQSHQLLQLGYTGIHRAILLSDPESQVMAFPMIVTLFLFIICFGLIIWYSIAKPWRSSRILTKAEALARREYAAIGLTRELRIQDLLTIQREKLAIFKGRVVNRDHPFHWQLFQTRLLLLLAYQADASNSAERKNELYKELIQMKKEFLDIVDDMFELAEGRERGSLSIKFPILAYLEDSTLGLNQLKIVIQPLEILQAFAQLLDEEFEESLSPAADDKNPSSRRTKASERPEHIQRVRDLPHQVAKIVRHISKDYPLAACNLLTIVVRSTSKPLDGLDFSGGNISGAVITGAIFRGCDFTDVDMRGVVATKTLFQSCDFSRTSIAGARFCQQANQPAVPLIEFVQDNNVFSEHKLLKRILQYISNIDGSSVDSSEVALDLNEEQKEKDLSQAAMEKGSHESAYSGIGISRNGLVAASNCKGVSLWSVKDAKHKFTLWNALLGFYLRGCAISPNGRYVAATGMSLQTDSDDEADAMTGKLAEEGAIVGGEETEEGILVLFDVTKRTALWSAPVAIPRTLPRSVPTPARLKFSSNSSLLATEYQVYDCATGVSLIDPAHASPKDVPKRRSCDWFPDGKRILFNHQTNVFQVWTLNVNTGLFAPEGNVWKDKEQETVDQERFTFSLYGGTAPSAMDISPDTRLAAIGWDQPLTNVLLFDLNRWSEVSSLSRHSNGVKDLRFAPDGRHLATCDMEKVCLWDSRSCALTGEINQRTLCLDWSIDSRRLICAGYTVLLWPSEGARPNLNRTPKNVRAISYTDGTLLTANPYSVSTWDPNTLTLNDTTTMPIRIPGDGLQSVALTSEAGDMEGIPFTACSPFAALSHHLNPEYTLKFKAVDKNQPEKIRRAARNLSLEADQSLFPCPIECFSHDEWPLTVTRCTEGNFILALTENYGEEGYSFLLIPHAAQVKAYEDFITEGGRGIPIRKVAGPSSAMVYEDSDDDINDDDSTAAENENPSGRSELLKADSLLDSVLPLKFKSDQIRDYYLECVRFRYESQYCSGGFLDYWDEKFLFCTSRDIWSINLELICDCDLEGLKEARAAGGFEIRHVHHFTFDTIALRYCDTEFNRYGNSNMQEGKCPLSNQLLENLIAREKNPQSDRLQSSYRLEEFEDLELFDKDTSIPIALNGMSLIPNEYLEKISGGIPHWYDALRLEKYNPEIINAALKEKKDRHATDAPIVVLAHGPPNHKPSAASQAPWVAAELKRRREEDTNRMWYPYVRNFIVDSDQGRIFCWVMDGIDSCSIRVYEYNDDYDPDDDYDERESSGDGSSDGSHREEDDGTDDGDDENSRSEDQEQNSRTSNEKEQQQEEEEEDENLSDGRACDKQRKGSLDKNENKKKKWLPGESSCNTLVPVDIIPFGYGDGVDTKPRSMDPATTAQKCLELCRPGHFAVSSSGIVWVVKSERMAPESKVSYLYWVSEEVDEKVVAKRGSGDSPDNDDDDDDGNGRRRYSEGKPPRVVIKYPIPHELDDIVGVAFHEEDIIVVARNEIMALKKEAILEWYLQSAIRGKHDNNDNGKKEEAEEDEFQRENERPIFNLADFSGEDQSSSGRTWSATRKLDLIKEGERPTLFLDPIAKNWLTGDQVAKLERRKEREAIKKRRESKGEDHKVDASSESSDGEEDNSNSPTGGGGGKASIVKVAASLRPYAERRYTGAPTFFMDCYAESWDEVKQIAKQ